MSAELFRLRETTESDLSYLLLMAQGQEIGIPPNYLDGGTTAVNDDDVPVGYIHIEQTPKGPHVAPVVVFEEWQHFGVGKALIYDALARNSFLKLVSNGSSNGFYEKLGFTPVSWDEIEPAFRRDCLECMYYERCNPKPYRLDA